MSIENKVDHVFAAWDSTHTPGCSLAVIKENEIIYKRGYGMANLEYGIPIRPDTIFHIASVSKHFCAMAVTLLAHEGKCSLDDPIQKHVPEMPDFGETITLQHLIYHSSGIRDQWELLVSVGWRMDDVITMQDILELLYKQQELNFKPNDEYLYSNSGYTLLAETVHRISGKTLREFCDERFFKPLGMLDTHFHDDHTMIVPNRAYSYSAGKNGYSNAVLNYANVGATSLFTTVEDMAKWDKEFYECKVIPEAVIKQMHNVCVLNDGEESGYAHGLMIDEYRGLKRVGHSGGDAGYRTHWMRFPEQKFSVVVFANEGNISPSSLCEKITDIYLEDQLAPLPEQTDQKEVKLSPEKLKSLVGVYYSEKAGSTHRVELKNDMLFVAIGPGIPLKPLSETEFCLIPMPNIKLSFEEIDGTIQLSLIMAGKPETYLKVEDYTLPEDKMDEYTGTYYCPELEVDHNIIQKDGKLVLSRRKYYQCAMTAFMPDGFEVELMKDWKYNITFDRSEDDAVCGFYMSTGRVRNLKFVKKD